MAKTIIKAILLKLVVILNITIYV
jgi:hypothetical protein